MNDSNVHNEIEQTEVEESANNAQTETGQPESGQNPSSQDAAVESRLRKEERRRERRERRNRRLIQRQQQHQTDISNLMMLEAPYTCGEVPDLLHSHVPPPYSTLPPNPPPYNLRNPPPGYLVGGAGEGRRGWRSAFSGFRSRPSNEGHPADPFYMDSSFGKSCCGVPLSQTVSIRWFIVMIAFVGICCAIVGTVLGAMKASGREHLTVSLLMIGVGIILITVSGIAWRITSTDAPSCRAMLGLGYSSAEECGPEGGASRTLPRVLALVNGSNNNGNGGNNNNGSSHNTNGNSAPGAGGQRHYSHHHHHPYSGGMVYNSEFQYRPPPPSYQASMQEYRLRLLLMDRSTVQQPPPPPHAAANNNNGSNGLHRSQPTSMMSPPPAYRPPPLIRTAGPTSFLYPASIHADASRPPSYRSRASDRTAVGAAAANNFVGSGGSQQDAATGETSGSGQIVPFHGRHPSQLSYLSQVLTEEREEEVLDQHEDNGGQRPSSGPTESNDRKSAANAHKSTATNANPRVLLQLSAATSTSQPSMGKTTRATDTNGLGATTDGGAVEPLPFGQLHHASVIPVIPSTTTMGGSHESEAHEGFSAPQHKSSIRIGGPKDEVSVNKDRYFANIKDQFSLHKEGWLPGTVAGKLLMSADKQRSKAAATSTSGGSADGGDEQPLATAQLSGPVQIVHNQNVGGGGNNSSRSASASGRSARLSLQSGVIVTISGSVLEAPAAIFRGRSASKSPIGKSEAHQSSSNRSTPEVDILAHL